MSKFSNKKVVSMSSLVFLLSIFVLTPITLGQTSFATATEITEGYYEAQMMVGGGFTPELFYKISCSSGDTLNVTTFKQSPYNIELFIFDSSETQVAADTNDNDVANCVYTCASDGWHYIKVNTSEGTATVVGYNLLVFHDETDAIPGFEFILIFFSLLITVGFVLFYKKRLTIAA